MAESGSQARTRLHHLWVCLPDRHLDFAASMQMFYLATPGFVAAFSLDPLSRAACLDCIANNTYVAYERRVCCNFEKEASPTWSMYIRTCTHYNQPGIAAIGLPCNFLSVMSIIHFLSQPSKRLPKETPEAQGCECLRSCQIRSSTSHLMWNSVAWLQRRQWSSSLASSTTLVLWLCPAVMGGL